MVLQKHASRFVMVLGVFAVVCVAVSQLAMAEGPAVSRLNGKADAVFGKFDSEDVYIGAMSLCLPVGDPIGVQIDGAYGDYSAEEYEGVGGHLFWRDPDRMLIGITGSHQQVGEISLIRSGLEMECYNVENMIIRLAGGYQWGDAEEDGYGSIGLNYYPISHLRFGAKSELTGNDFLQTLGMEYQPAEVALPGLSLIAEGALGEDDYDRFIVGLRYYFGEDKPLIMRHRQDDPPNLLPDGMQHLARAYAESREGPSPYKCSCPDYNGSNGYNGYSMD